MLRRRRKLFIIGAAIAIALAVFSCYLIFGWGLPTSDRMAGYKLIDYWTQANGQAFDDPFAIAVDPRNGNVVVTDARHQRVVVFEPSGRFVREFGARGHGPGRFERPTGIAVAGDGSIYVADFELDRIQKFTDLGEYLLHWGGPGEVEEQFQGPNGLAVDSGGQVYIADFQNKRVKVFDADGRFLRALGRPGQWGPGALDYPTDVAIGPDESVLVADAYNYRVQRFDREGGHEASWGWHVLWLWPRPNSGDRGFNVPTGVAFDPHHQLIHIADSGNRRLVMLDADGGFIADWPIPERTAQHAPTSLAVSPDGGRVYATDVAHDRVIVLAVEPGN